MCEFAGRLIAWMDGELNTHEAAQVEQHMAACEECRNCVTEFRRVSDAFTQCCEAMTVAEETSAAGRWTPVLCGVAAAVAAGFVALVLAVPRPQITTPAMLPAVSVVSASSVATRAEAPSVAIAAMHSAAPRNTRHRRELNDYGRVATTAEISRLCRGEACGPAATDMPPASWLADDATIQIAIPAEAMFLPGAVPEGVNFVADVSLGADGAVEQVRLRPRLVRFEKGAN